MKKTKYEKIGTALGAILEKYCNIKTRGLIITKLGITAEINEPVTITLKAYVKA